MLLIIWMFEFIPDSSHVCLNINKVSAEIKRVQFNSCTDSKTEPLQKPNFSLITVKNHQHSCDLLYAQTEPRVSSNKKKQMLKLHSRNYTYTDLHQ